MSIKEDALWDLINSAELRMSIEQLNLWKAVRIQPRKWIQKPHGNAGSGFWSVAIIGNQVIWYNDIEEGFNRSIYSDFGTIDQYWCDQDELEITIQKLSSDIKGGYFKEDKTDPPIKK